MRADDQAECRGSPTVGCAPFSLSLQLNPGEGLRAFVDRLSSTLIDSKATVLKLLMFGSTAAAASVVQELRAVFGDADFPITWVECADCEGRPVAGVQVFARVGGRVQRIRQDDRVVASVFEHDGARHFLAGGLGPADLLASRFAQTQETFVNLEQTLARAGFEFRDIVRTWFYPDDILTWYNEFNQARTQFYSGIQFRSGAAPASTGVGARNPARAALVAAAWAVQPLNRSIQIRNVHSPLQCPAHHYGSSFSRALEICSPRARLLLISGTAAIAPDGTTAHPGDAEKQIALTMDVVAAILESRDLGVADVLRAAVYVSEPGIARVFGQWRSRHGLERLPVIGACSDLCRPDLLFEIELDAQRQLT